MDKYIQGNAKKKGSYICWTTGLVEKHGSFEDLRFHDQREPGIQKSKVELNGNYDDDIAWNNEEEYGDLVEGYEEDEKDYPEEYDLEYLKNYEEPVDDYEDEPRRTSPVLRIVALVTALFFMGLVLTASWPLLESASYKIHLSRLLAYAQRLATRTGKKAVCPGLSRVCSFF
ncbi:hypothetical protein IT084_05730 [Desulfallas sp. Bu1-1]|uniref:hypothetical protein n=1 Tax=Desulfallas sp. Bu1-1 TaxID=2787620 RepID=UPI00189EDD40|nr:hypothetical protein [Desulfallas sp. Bu1-1]MBF7082478.1 hypothetical protein [Desulfallas sp. Bu1-1]